MSITACVVALEAAAAVSVLVSLAPAVVFIVVVVVFRKDEDVVFNLDVVNGFGAAYFVRSLVTLV
jgi:hypothetical protein